MEHRVQYDKHKLIVDMTYLIDGMSNEEKVELMKLLVSDSDILARIVEYAVQGNTPDDWWFSREVLNEKLRKPIVEAMPAIYREVVAYCFEQLKHAKVITEWYRNHSEKLRHAWPYPNQAGPGGATRHAPPLGDMPFAWPNESETAKFLAFAEATRKGEPTNEPQTQQPQNGQTP